MKRIVLTLLAVALLLGCGQRKGSQTALTDGNHIEDSLHRDRQEAIFTDNGYRSGGDDFESGSWTLGDVSGREYLRVFHSHIEPYGIESVSFHDITGDGFPEVWLFTNRCEAERMVLVYSIRDWNRELFRVAAGHSCFYKGKGYALRLWAHMGDAFWYRIRWDGKKIITDRVFEEHTVPFYTSPSEEPFVEICPEELDPAELLKWIK